MKERNDGHDEAAVAVAVAECGCGWKLLGRVLASCTSESVWSFLVCGFNPVPILAGLFARKRTEKMVDKNG